MIEHCVVDINTMDTGIVQVLVGCILIDWNFGFGQNSTFCKQRYHDKQRFPDVYFVNVCQENDGSLGKAGEIIILDPAEAPLQQDVECKCYISFDERHQHVTITTFIYNDGTHDAEFKIDGSAYNNIVRMGSQQITSETTVLFQQGHQDDPPHVCVGISNADTQRGSLTIRCEAYVKDRSVNVTTTIPATPTPARSRPETTETLPVPETIPTHPLPETIPTHPLTETTPNRPLPETIPTHSMPKTISTRSLPETAPTRSLPETIPTLSMSETVPTLPMREMTSTQSTNTDTDGSTNALTVILCTNIGVILLVGIVVCCVVRRKRTSTQKMVKDSKPNDKRMGDSKDKSEEGTEEHLASARRTCNTRNTHSIMTSEYAYVDHSDLTASAEVNFNQPTESDVYNYLNEVQPGPHSDNVYSTPHVYITTNKKSVAMSQHGLIKTLGESDVYNHLNEVRSSPHTDNIYNETNVHESGASSSQYDSVEIVTRQHDAQPDSDYNVLSFP